MHCLGLWNLTQSVVLGQQARSVSRKLTTDGQYSAKTAYDFQLLATIPQKQNLLSGEPRWKGSDSSPYGACTADWLTALGILKKVTKKILTNSLGNWDGPWWCLQALWSSARIATIWFCIAHFAKEVWSCLALTSQQPPPLASQRQPSHRSLRATDSDPLFVLLFQYILARFALIHPPWWRSRGRGPAIYCICVHKSQFLLWWWL